MNNLPQRPTTKIVKECLKSWQNLEDYQAKERSLELLFDLFAENKTIEHVLLKVSALNDFYSTRIFSTYSVAKHILTCNIDAELTKGKPDLDLVDKIASIKIGDKPRRFYSFASKYCAHHKPKVYSIYDSYVDKMLWHFKNQDDFYRFNKEDLKDYGTFMQVILEFKKYYGLTECSRRDIDIYLWLTGKKYFPNEPTSKKPTSKKQRLGVVKNGRFELVG